MQSVGYAALEVIPSMKGFEGRLSGQTTPILGRSGAVGGRKFGAAAGASAASEMRSHLTSAAKYIIGGFLATRALTEVTGLVKTSISEAQDSQKVGRVTEARIRSTGKAANLTAGQIGKLSGALSKKVGIDDETIQRGANMLLTFTNIRNGVGKSNKIFTEATGITTDLAASMAGSNGGEPDLKSASILVGKALNDPAKGLTALTRVGVAFTDQQKKQITALTDAGNLAGAQQIILGELQKEFGGTAAAQATVADKLKVAWGNTEEALGKKLLPLMHDFQRFLLQKGIPAAQDFVQWFGKKGVPEIHKFVDEARPLAESLLPAVSHGFKDIGGFLKTAALHAKAMIDAFNSLPDWAKKAVVLGAAGGYLAKKTGALNLGMKALGGGGGIPGLTSAVKGTPVDPVWVRVIGGVPGAPGEPGGKTPPGIVDPRSVANGGKVAEAEAEAAKAAKAAAEAVKAAGGGVASQSQAAARAFKEAMAGSDLAVSRGALARFAGRAGLRGLLGTLFEAPAGVALGSYKADMLHPTPITGIGSVPPPSSTGAKSWVDLDKAFTHLIKSGNIQTVEDKMHTLAVQGAAIAGSSNPAIGYKALDDVLPKTIGKLDKLTTGSQVAGRGFRQLGQGANSTLDQVTTKTQILDAHLRGLPKSLVTRYQIDTREALAKLREVHSMAGRPLTATYNIELAGRPSPGALDGVRR